VGASVGPVVVKKSTFYGFGQTIFLCQTNTASVSISDCTFDNFTVAPGTSPRYVIDLGTQASPITVTNCIFGSTTATKYSKGFKTGGTVTISNSYRTSDCFLSISDSIVATGGITGSIVAYTGSAATVFKTPSTSVPGASFSNTADYTIIDAAFPGKNNAGDSRWYTPTAVVSPKVSSKVISYNGTQISLNETQDIAIYNVTGELLKSAKKVNVLSVANLQKGVYIIKAGTAVQKFIAQ